MPVVSRGLTVLGQRPRSSLPSERLRLRLGDADHLAPVLYARP
eukprot:COSAG06_NODE_44484_length_363_cov_0.712121_1_plen_42_part_01